MRLVCYFVAMSESKIDPLMGILGLERATMRALLRMQPEPQKAAPKPSTRANQSQAQLARGRAKVRLRCAVSPKTVSRFCAGGFCSVPASKPASLSASVSGAEQEHSTNINDWQEKARVFDPTRKTAASGEGPSCALTRQALSDCIIRRRAPGASRCLPETVG